mmetsp:Transcript_21906/g.51198  ORF Transcript_21906/g.51198 Transcript_21906/m.51198 type:complete len:83 (+) Transcript_21906:2151-2399(+)
MLTCSTSAGMDEADPSELISTRSCEADRSPSWLPLPLNEAPRVPVKSVHRYRTDAWMGHNFIAAWPLPEIGPCIQQDYSATV